VFNRYTKPKARRRWRLLIIDGHGSHVTMDFIRFCDNNKILLCILPPHSTHTLQPLDVVCFSPLATKYSQELTNRLHTSLGWVPLKKGDFFSIFWAAWSNTFTEKLVLKAFEATGISPLNREAVLQRFRASTPDGSQSSKTSTSCYSGGDWPKVETLVRKSVKDTSSSESRKILRTLHHLVAQNELIYHELEGVKDALKEKKQRSTKRRVLPLQQHEEYHGGAVFWSPRARREAEVRYQVFQRLEHEEELAKADRKQLKHNNKLLKEKLKEERRVGREAAKLVREKEKAELANQKAKHAAEKRRQKEARDAQKALQLSQRGNRTASKPVIRDKKRV
jgi:hypothetical protein